MSMETIPIWDAPHSFAHPGRRVFTYGLLLPELDRLRDADARTVVASRWGEVEVDTLVRKLVPTTAIPGTTVSDVTVINRLADFRAALRTAADRREVVPVGFEDDLRWFLNVVRRPDLFSWLTRVLGDQRVRVRTAHYHDLLERLAIEFDHLVTRRPRLSRCKLCGRVFVPHRPSRPEAHCRANLWLATLPPSLLERCVPLDLEAERNRTEKRLHQRYRRALDRHGKGAAETKAALRAWSEWKRENPPVRERGRQPTPEAIYQPEATDADGDDGDQAPSKGEQ